MLQKSSGGEIILIYISERSEEVLEVSQDEKE